MTQDQMRLTGAGRGGLEKTGIQRLHEFFRRLHPSVRRLFLFFCAAGLLARIALRFTLFQRSAARFVRGLGLGGSSLPLIRFVEQEARIVDRVAESTAELGLLRAVLPMLVGEFAKRSPHRRHRDRNCQHQRLPIVGKVVGKVCVST